MHRSLRSLLPFILANLGLLITFFWETLPLFEWQISDVVTDFPSIYNVSIESSPWTAYIGDSLDDGLYVSHQVSVEIDGELCREEDFNFLVRRSQNDQALKRALRVNKIENLLWLNEWSAIELLLCVGYIWLFIIWYEGLSGWGLAVIYTGIAGGIFFLGSQIARILSPIRLFAYDFGVLDCYGTIMFNAVLSKVHYETLVVVFAFILLEVGALGVMVGQIIKAVTERNVSTTSDVG